MAQLDALRKYLEAGMAFTQTTRARAEEIVANLVRAGELQTEQTQQQVQDLVDRSRQNTDRLVDVVRKEILAQLGSLGFATKADLAKLERKVDAAVKATKPAAAKKATATNAVSARKSTAKKSTAKKSTTKKSAAKKSPAKKAAASKA
jgi:polyhydroxyalkanoate synthesis regulator phasin